MAIRDIRLFGDPILNTEAAEITEFSPSVRTLALDMLETMEDAGGVGLAANQVGIAKRIFVYDCTKVQPGMRGVLINPTWQPYGSKLQRGREGCLSIPGISVDTTRYQTVTVSGFDMEGRPVGFVVSGLMARCVQHETDHLDGVLFLQRLDPEDRKAAMREIRQSDWFNS
ncbi:peptide deformylase [Corynebacterium phocae]|uniref:Peptide deformylase n=1 Tax=Corynebacterium phocae TaxID=161895 RepID=A0A1L7D2V0_9CORY|nr:peptide deformylase [Corynebacterium phocae]APT92469.1 peptide deformylase [Corynebacterium phocae]KAA8725074.1 peptide deformylase [Corynebacterium phocae]